MCKSSSRDTELENSIGWSKAKSVDGGKPAPKREIEVTKKR